MPPMKLALVFASIVSLTLGCGGPAKKAPAGPAPAEPGPASAPPARP